MAEWKEFFKTNENQNWAKCVFAIKIAREGLIEYCKKEIETFHASITSKLPQGTVTACTGCTVSDIIPYSRPGHTCKQGECKCPSKPCPFGICDKMKDNIEKEHRYKHISWKNTKISDWLCCPWEVAKCYFPLTGYQGKSDEETDFNGLISLLINNKIFETTFSQKTCDDVGFITSFYVDFDIFILN